MILYTSLQWLGQNMNVSLNPQKTPHLGWAIGCLFCSCGEKSSMQISITVHCNWYLHTTVINKPVTNKTRAPQPLWLYAAAVIHFAIMPQLCCHCPTFISAESHTIVAQYNLATALDYGWHVCHCMIVCIGRWRDIVWNLYYEELALRHTPSSCDSPYPQTRSRRGRSSPPHSSWRPPSTAAHQDSHGESWWRPGDVCRLQWHLHTSRRCCH